MAWQGVLKRRQHSYHRDMMSFSAEELNESFGRNKFSEINARLNIFEYTPGWSKARRYTRGFRFKYEVKIALTQYFDRALPPDSIELVMADGKTLRSVPAAIASKDADGVTTTAWANARGLNLVAVNLEELERLQLELLRDCEIHRAASAAAGDTTFSELRAVERVISEMHRVKVLCHTRSGGKGFMAHHYVESTSGRIYPVGVSLASTSGLVKEAALLDCWEYDISNCHFTLLARMAGNLGCRCDEIEYYLENKAEIRGEIAAAAGISIDQTKRCLLALLYGATFTVGYKGEILLDVGKDAVEKLIRTPAFANFRKDISRARDTLIARCERSSKGWIKNAFGKTVSPAATKVQQFAHLLQGAEAKALQAAINLYPDQIVLAQHDGFVSKSRIDMTALEHAVLTATGFALRYEERQLRPAPATYFTGRL